MNILIQGGRVIDPANQLDNVTNLYISDGKILAVGEAPDNFSADQIIDASNKVVCPGFIDLSAHTCEPGPSQKGSIKTESDAAVAGGVTTLMTPPTTAPVIDTSAVAELIKDRCEEAGKMQILPMGALTKGLDGEQLAPMAALASSGCVAFSNCRKPVANSLILMRCLEYAATHDLLVVFQAQDEALAKGGSMHDGSTCTRLGLNGIPESAETIEVARCLLMAEQTGVRAHFGQLSCERSVRMISEARERGLPVTADVSIQNLLLTDENVNGFNNDFHLIPPLRSQLDRAGLIQGLLSGTIQAICSDHQPHERAAKEAPFADTESGMIGLETLLSLTLILVEQNMLELPQLIEKLTSAPAEILGLETGTLTVGKPANIAIFDQEMEWALNAETCHSRGKNTPFMDYPLKGRVCTTLFKGKVVYQLED
ncbi:dihydroorotase [Neptuniibacter caesariensis]|uniref:Dihydroorotase, multifunctional complex type n=1 Tax=Neptuniibacter caesariensis TaxID=207954 RepID=A0A7U8C959_NEPCE|nr:dihydroorotase [Neptuniibacter caesariensis]EAR62881.1 dihydroorotase, multifunctional complex type [Oceanospirillum sp. MED92] [Neptuniibacter caesariensis]